MLFDSQCNYVRTQFNQPSAGIYRCPDLLLFDGKHRNAKEVITDKPILAYELDGAIHDINWDETLFRNKQYNDARIPIVVTNKREIETSIFDDAYQKISKVLDIAK